MLNDLAINDILDDNSNYSLNFMNQKNKLKGNSFSDNEFLGLESLYSVQNNYIDNNSEFQFTRKENKHSGKKERADTYESRKDINVSRKNSIKINTCDENFKEKEIIETDSILRNKNQRNNPSKNIENEKRIIIADTQFWEKIKFVEELFQSKENKNNLVLNKNVGEENITLKYEDFNFGNFERFYYNKFLSIFNDERMKYFDMEMFKDKKCLDIGCNNGILTILIALNFQPKKIEGIDIEFKMIKKAIENYKFVLKNNLNSNFINKLLIPNKSNENQSNYKKLVEDDYQMKYIENTNQEEKEINNISNKISINSEKNKQNEGLINLESKNMEKKSLLTLDFEDYNKDSNTGKVILTYNRNLLTVHLI